MKDFKYSQDVEHEFCNEEVTEIIDDFEKKETEMNKRKEDVNCMRIQITNFCSNKIDFNGNEDGIATCISDLMRVGDGEITWEELGIDPGIVEHVYTPFYQDPEYPNRIEMETRNDECEDLFEKLCENYGLHGTLEYKELGFRKFGEYEFTAEGEKYWRAVDPISIDQLEEVLEEQEEYVEGIGGYEKVHEYMLRWLLNQKEQLPWIDDPMTKEERYEWFKNMIKESKVRLVKVG